MHFRFVDRMKGVVGILVLAAVDIAAVLAVFRLSVFVRTTVLPLLYGGFPPDPPLRSISNLLWFVLVWLFFLQYEGLYGKRFSFWDEIEALVKVSFLSTATIFVIISVGKMAMEISRTLVVLMGFFAIIILPLFRIPVKRALQRIGILNKRVLIIGASSAGRRIAKALAAEANYGYTVVWFLDDNPETIGTYINGCEVYGNISSAHFFMKRYKINDIFIALPDDDRIKARNLITELQHKAEHVLYVPDMPGVVAAETGLVHFFNEQVFAFEIRNNMSRKFNIVIKRCVDIIISTLAIAFLCIPFLLVVLIIRLDSKGPALFRQTRIGKDRRPFICYKVRTMYLDADKRLNKILSSNPAAKEEWEKYRKLKNDPRITRIGRFLRRFSLDELPQFFNVFMGNMSIVGPRPVLQEEIDLYYKDMADFCFSVRPGITGLWQVSGRNNSNYDQRIALDAWYIKNWHLWLDVVIILKTIGITARASGAY